jgi:hypothetical protein
MWGALEGTTLGGGQGCAGEGVRVSLWSFSPVPTLSQGDIQELLISPDPQDAFQACEKYLPGCDSPDPPTSGVSERLHYLTQGPGLSHSGSRWEEVSSNPNGVE